MFDTTPTSLPDFTIGAVNLASARLGATALYATDEFFAPLSRMLADEPAKFLPDVYDDNGKWMDGWESRRKRVEGHDWGVIKLAMPGIIHGFDVDTSHFTGNFPPHCAIEALALEAGEPTDDSAWEEILPKSPLGPGIGAAAHHFFPVDTGGKVYTHLRLHIFPDGGIARLRVYGTAHFDWSKVGAEEEVDLAYIYNGAKSLAWSNAHYGVPDQMLGPGRGINMGDGWETARRRGPGHDWAIIRLGHPGLIRRVVVDTAHFKGNFPDTCHLLGAYLPGHGDTFSEEEIAASENWTPILPRQKLSMDHIHDYGADIVADIGPVTHVRYAMFPDGGTSRLRLFGVKA
ncbi:allantoicase [Rhizobium rhizosphaerae]|uniref:Probable allantoicase n=1 Tax=Xaviernesmea rhizosphaerae TaxID=1672749 RepID=A0ABX3PHG6_9HYPH|nr:allantoicase [Xaviernesmea rhizosphaerae]OQP87630.1 allantoicase [Xaviernesmea rhizosphaerae]